jgi:RimJ/RimL family protein N-acetyltransferase
VKIRPAGPDDAQLLWQWRNDPLVRQNSFNSQSIPWTDHEVWYARRLASPDICIYLLEKDGKPVAQIRYERRDGSIAEVGDISVAAVDRRKGYGTEILVQTVDRACTKLEAKELFAVVKENNFASAGMFRAAGFEPQSRINVDGWDCIRFFYSYRTQSRAK